jgi:alkylated DNA repair protein alkB family protein 1
MFNIGNCLIIHVAGVPRIFTDNENAEIDHLETHLTHEDDLCFLKYIQTSRININIRQVF